MPSLPPLQEEDEREDEDETETTKKEIVLDRDHRPFSDEIKRMVVTKRIALHQLPVDEVEVVILI
jgi:hypothetical protein